MLRRLARHSSWKIETSEVRKYRKFSNHYKCLVPSSNIYQRLVSANHVPQHLKNTLSYFQGSSFCTRENENVQKSNGGSAPQVTQQQLAEHKLKYIPEERTGFLLPGLPVGFISGFLGSMAGIGGAVFAIPLLCRFGVRQRIAAGSMLFAVFGTAASSAYAFHQAGQVDYFTALNLSLMGLLAAPIGACFSNSVSSGILRRSLGIFLMFISPLMFIRMLLQKASEEKASEWPPPLEQNCLHSEGALVPAHFIATTRDYSAVAVRGWNELLYNWSQFSKEKFAFLSFTGATVGFLSGFLGVSGGTLYTPIISFIGCGDGSREFHKVLGTSFMAMTLPAITGGIAYAWKGSVRFSLVPSLCLGTVAGAALGSRVALKLPDSFLKVSMAIVFSLVGYRIYKVPIRPNIRSNHR